MKLTESKLEQLAILGSFDRGVRRRSIDKVSLARIENLEDEGLVVTSVTLTDAGRAALKERS